MCIFCVSPTRPLLHASRYLSSRQPIGAAGQRNRATQALFNEMIKKWFISTCSRKQLLCLDKKASCCMGVIMERIGASRLVISPVAVLLLVLLVAGCSSVTGGKEKAVWKNYDYLTPVPSTAPVTTTPGYRSRIRPPSATAPTPGAVGGRYDYEDEGVVAPTSPESFGSCSDEDLANYTCN